MSPGRLCFNPCIPTLFALTVITHLLFPKKKSLVGCRELSQGQEAASAGTDGGTEGTAKEAGGMAVKVADKVLAAKSYVVRKEQIWDLQRMFDGKKGSLRTTYKTQPDASDKVRQQNENSEQSLNLLATFYECSEAASRVSHGHEV